MLSAAGISPGKSGANAQEVLRVWRRFAGIAVDDAAPTHEGGDGILAQFGTWRFRGPSEFSVDLTRQFIDGNDDNALMWQLSCTLYWEPDLETDSLGSGDVWSFGQDIDEFFEQAAMLPGWVWALTTSREPGDLCVEMSAV
jgi:hypothetical protein